MEFRLLGQLEVADEHGQLLTIPGRRPQTLLAILLLRANQTVQIQQLFTDLWGDAPPASARESVHFFVHRLRRALSPQAGPGQHGGVLETHGSGYLLRVAPEQLDTRRFRRLVDQARSDRQAGADARALEGYESALALWRGPALLDFRDEAFAQSEVGRLEELRLSCTEEHHRTGLQLGRHAELVGELEALVTEYPVREQSRALLMLALYRSGRQAEALEVYHAARQALTDHLGVEPGAELQTLQRRILAHDPSLGLPAARSSLPLVMAVGRGVPAAPAPPGGSGHDPESADPDPAAGEHGEAVEERKVVTVLAADLAGGQPLDPEDTRAHLTDIAERLRGRVERYGGVVQALALGGLLAVFGVPRSREDDPERAVRAALEVCAETPAATRAQLRVGLATGEVVVTFTGPVADPAGMTVDGEVLHAATALQALAATGGVVVGAGTWRATRRVIDYEPVIHPSPAHHAIGLRAWQALAPKARTGVDAAGLPSSPLVERERELKLLDGLLERCLRKQEPQLLTVVGESGLGKSRLVAELGHLVDQMPELVSWRRGRCSPYRRGSFVALAEIVKAHAGILDSDPQAAAETKLGQAVTDRIAERGEAEWVARQLGALLGPNAAALPAGEQPAELVAAWTRFLGAAAAQRPLVMVVEDLQWADDALLDFIDDLAGQVGPVPLLVAATARPELLDRRADWGGGKPNAATVSLSPLTRDGTAKLLDTLLHGGDRIDAATRATLLTASGGNPLYIEEYAHMLLDRAAPTTEALSLPETVQQVIAARIDALQVDHKRLLQDAAVIGEVGWAGALVAVGGWDRAQVDAGLRHLERHEFLRRIRVASVAGETEYRFRHALVREVAYAQMLRTDRAERHQRSAAWLEGLSPDPGERVELLAHHYGQALALTQAAGQPCDGLVDRARSTARAAGDRATALGAPGAAAHHYRDALELWPQADPARPELLVRLGQALVYSRHAGEEVLVQARAAAVAAGRADLVAVVDALRGLVAVIFATAPPEGTSPAAAGGSDSAPAALETLSSQTIQLLLADRHADARTVADQLVCRARDLGHAGHEGNGLSLSGGARIRAGDLGGLADVERGLALMDAHRFPIRVFARYGHARSLWWYGDLARCAGAVTTGRRVAEAAESAVAWWFDGLQAGLDYAAGRWDQTIAAADGMLQRQSVERVAVWLHLLRAQVRLGRGDGAGALADARTALADASPEDRRHQQVALALSGRALLLQDRRDEAAACLDKLLADQHEHPAESCVTADAAVLLVDLGYPADALPRKLTPTRWHHAAQALAARDHGGAVELFTAVGSAVDAAQARLRLAAALAAAGQPAQARTVLHQAAGVFEQAGATRYLSDAQTLAAAFGPEPAS